MGSGLVSGRVHDLREGVASLNCEVEEGGFEGERGGGVRKGISTHTKKHSKTPATHHKTFFLKKKNTEKTKRVDGSSKVVGEGLLRKEGGSKGWWASKEREGEWGLKGRSFGRGRLRKGMC